MVRAPDVDEVLPPAVDLVLVVREVVAQIGGVAVRLHEHAVALVAEILGPQPRRAVLLVGEARGLQPFEDRGDLAALVQRPLREPGVEVDADATEILPELVHHHLQAPFARLLLGDVVTPLGAQALAHLDEIRALVAVLGQLGPRVPREQ